MSYEEFLDLPVDYVRRIIKNLNYKRENRIPLSEEESELQNHFIYYTQDLKLREEKERLEYMWSLDSYEK